MTYASFLWKFFNNYTMILEEITVFGKLFGTDDSKVFSSFQWWFSFCA